MTAAGWRSSAPRVTSASSSSSPRSTSASRSTTVSTRRSRRSSELPLVEEHDGPVGWTLAVRESAALIQGASRSVLLARAEVHADGPRVTGGVHGGLEQRPADALPAALGRYVELLEVGVERPGPHRGAKAKLGQSVGPFAAEQHQHLAIGDQPAGA